MPLIALLRHGPTVLNETGRLRGWMDPPLSVDGVRQAEAVVLPFAAPVHSSDLCRATQTADIVARGAPVVHSPALRPWNVGVFQGQPTEIVHPRLVQYQTSDLRVPFGEPWSDFVRRFLGYVQQLRSDTILVTHFRCCKLLLAFAAGGFRCVDMSVMQRDDVGTATVSVVNVPEFVL